jgi:hypothetical protein
LNCGRVGPDSRYCPHCGQERVEPIPSVKTLLRHLFDDVFSMDSKIARTLAALIARPGWLTVEYLQGRQVHYVRPLRLYLVLSLVFFVILTAFGENQFVVSTGGDLASGDPQSEASVARTDSVDIATAGEVGDALRAAKFEDPVRKPLRREFARAQLDSLWVAALDPENVEANEDDFASLRAVPLLGGASRREPRS